MNKIFLLSDSHSFSDYIELCLKEDSLELETSNRFLVRPNEFDIVIVNLLNLRKGIEFELKRVLESNVKKVIILENALNLYLNSNNKTPFSIYTKIEPKNEVCQHYLNIEKQVIESQKKYVILRISEIYGSSMPRSIINQLMFSKTEELEDCSRDFIYEGDVIQAIEISLRKEVTGIFDIASGKSIQLKRLTELVQKFRKHKFDIKWNKNQQDIIFNCENFKFYKWQPLISIEMGLKALSTLNRR